MPRTREPDRYARQARERIEWLVQECCHGRAQDLADKAGVAVGRPNKHTPWDVPLETHMAPDLQPYLLRHTFCTDLEAVGVPINIARDLMGHSSIAITSKVYTHRTEASHLCAR